MCIIPKLFVSNSYIWHPDDLRDGKAGVEYKNRDKVSDERISDISFESIGSGLDPKKVQSIVDACKLGCIPQGYEVRNTNLVDLETGRPFPFQGLFATKFIKKYTVIGVYESSTTNIRPHEGYVMEVQELKKVKFDNKTYYIPKAQRKVSRLIDAREPKKSTFVRYINAASDKMDDAMNKVNVAFADAMSSNRSSKKYPVIIVYALENIFPGQELLADYGSDYWEI